MQSTIPASTSIHASSTHPHPFLILILIVGGFVRWCSTSYPSMSMSMLLCLYCLCFYVHVYASLSILSILSKCFYVYAYASMSMASLLLCSMSMLLCLCLCSMSTVCMIVYPPRSTYASIKPPLHHEHHAPASNSKIHSKSLPFKAHAPELLHTRRWTNRRKLGMNLNGSWQLGHSTTYNTPFQSHVVCMGFPFPAVSALALREVPRGSSAPRLPSLVTSSGLSAYPYTAVPQERSNHRA